MARCSIVAEIVKPSATDDSFLDGKDNKNSTFVLPKISVATEAPRTSL